MCGIIDGLLNETQTLQVFWGEAETDSVAYRVVETCGEKIT